MKSSGKKGKGTPPQRSSAAGQSSRRPVFSYYAGKADKTAAAQQARGTVARAPSGQKVRTRRLPAMLAIPVIFVILLYNLTLETNPRVSFQGNVESVLSQDPTVYQQAATKALSGSWRSGTKLTIDIQLLRQQLKTWFPEIQEVSVQLPLIGRRPIVLITPANPSVLLSGTSGTYVLDEQGRAILSAQQVSDPEVAKLPLLRDDSGLAVEIGRGVLPKQTVQYIRTVLAQLQAKDIHPESLALPALANEFHLRIKDRPYYVKFDTTGDPMQAAGTFMAVKQHLEESGQLPQEYIDVRIEERTYYK